MPPAEWRELAFRGLPHLTPREFGGATRAWAPTVWGSQTAQREYRAAAARLKANWRATGGCGSVWAWGKPIQIAAFAKVRRRRFSKRRCAPTLAAASEMTHAGRCSFTPALRQRECLESPADRAQSLSPLITVSMAAEVPTKNHEACRGLSPTSPLAAARTRAAATSADIVS